MEGRRFDVRPGYDYTSSKLHEESDDVEPNEVTREARAGNPKEGFGGKIKMDHAAENHVVECVDYYLLLAIGIVQDVRTCT